jgi:hypothetical protein
MMSLDEIFHAKASVRTVGWEAAFMEIGLGRPESDWARQGLNEPESVIEKENSLGICFGLIVISFEFEQLELL